MLNGIINLTIQGWLGLMLTCYRISYFIKGDFHPSDYQKAKPALDGQINKSRLTNGQAVSGSIEFDNNLNLRCTCSGLL